MLLEERAIIIEGWERDLVNNKRKEIEVYKKLKKINLNLLIDIMIRLSSSLIEDW